MPETTYLVCVNSRKGGVGKTCVALAIAHSWLSSNDRRPVVIVDGDLLGTEISDMLPPERPPGGRWGLGLLDLISQSTGGNTSFNEWLASWLREHKPEALPRERLLPLVDLVDGSDRPRAVLIPTLRERTGAGRHQERDGLALRLLTDDFGTAQLARRLAILFARLTEDWKPALIVFDNSPFDLSLGKVVRDLMRTPPKSVPAPLQGVFAERLRCCHLEVSGPEPSEIATLDGLAARLEDQDSATGLVLNRSPIDAPPPDAPSWCASQLFDLATQEATEYSEDAKRPEPTKLLDSRVAHLPVEPRLLVGALSHTQTLAETHAPSHTRAWRSFREGVAALGRGGERWNPESKRFEAFEWPAYLRDVLES